MLYHLPVTRLLLQLNSGNFESACGKLTLMSQTMKCSKQPTATICQKPLQTAYIFKSGSNFINLKYEFYKISS